mmetsp:Transcript_12242/g.28726  ORF Transcript_12242/g.28726 Transcript_12242/m.28726 type:complete len:246 (-) Transcript_12242:285-1022(-)
MGSGRNREVIHAFDTTVPGGLSNFLNDLNDILVCEHVSLANFLRLMFDRGAPDPGVEVILHYVSVEAVAKVLHRWSGRVKHHWLLVVRDLALGLGVDSHHLEVVPDLLHEHVDVPLVEAGDGHVVRHLVDDVQLLDGQLVDLVHHVQRRHVLAVVVDHVDELVRVVVPAQDDVRRGDAELLEDLGALVSRESLGLRDQLLVVDPAFVLSPEHDLRGLLVESDAEACELALDQPLMRHRLHAVEDD